MANLNKDATLGFGNSGGLDSRLVPIYAQEQNIEMAGITTVNKRSNSLLRSLTALNASKIAEIYQFRNHYMSHVIDAVEDRMILDIRNNPFGTCEVFKNPYKSLPSFNYYVTGGNGFIVGGAWTKYLNLNKDSEFLDAFYSYHSKLSAFGWIAEGAELVNKFFSKEDLDIFKNYKRRFYEENKHKSNLGIIRSYHQYCLNKRSPLGGFESVNGLYKTYNIYYPIVFEHTLSWNPDYFPNRIVLKRLIERKSPELFKIRSQNYDRLNGKPLNILEKVERRIALKYRGWGLDYENWAKEEGFKRYMTRTFSQKNELFFENLGLNHKEFVDLQIENKLRPHVFLDILKLKKIMDIVQKGDYEFASDKSLEIKRPQ